MNDSRAKKGQVYVHPATIDYYAQQTWKFAKAILWNNIPFLPEEIELALEYIRSYYRELAPELFCKIASRSFRENCERILMAKRYITINKRYRLPHPCIWFNPLNLTGFIGTKSWYAKRKRADKNDK